MLNVTIVGSGYVGLVTGVCLSNTGNEVTCLDIDESRIASMKAGSCPIYEPGLEELMHLNTKSGRLNFTSDCKQAYSGADLIFICVGTPTGPDGRSDLSAVMAVARDIAAAMNDTDCDTDHPLVIVKSTVPVGTTYKVRDQIAALTDQPFSVADNPEFLKEGDAIADFQKPDRIVCGIHDDIGRERLERLYEPFVRQDRPLMFMEIPSAEMVKYSSNAMLAAKISFINEMARLCEHYGADIRQVREGMCADRRIGREFLYPGLGYGGSCFPKDTLAVIEMGEDSNIPCLLNQAVHDVNQAQRPWFINRIMRHFNNDLKGVHVAVWGLAFKPNTDDVREAPAHTIITGLLDAGATVTAFDPIARDTFARYELDIKIVDDMYQALPGADALIVCTEWPEFRTPDFDRIKSTLKSPLVFDGRNIWDHDTMTDSGWIYYSVGRSAAHETVSS